MLHRLILVCGFAQFSSALQHIKLRGRVGWASPIRVDDPTTFCAETLPVIRTTRLVFLSYLYDLFYHDFTHLTKPARRVAQAFAFRILIRSFLLTCLDLVLASRVGHYEPP